MTRSASIALALALSALPSCDASTPSSDAGTLPGTDAPRPDGGPRPDAGPMPPLPEGPTGIASRFPGDVGIDGDSAVIFADDFERYADGSELGTRWNAGVYHNANITTEAANVHAGSQALEFLAPRESVELSNGVARAVAPELDRLFLRFYSRFEGTNDIVGSSHNGGGISAHYFPGGMATPGIPADGYNKFLVEYECWRGEAADMAPGSLNVYAYHPDQRSEWGDHFFPDGTVTPYSPTPFDFGPSFVSRPRITPEMDRWYAYEVMLQANTPGERDGRVALWLDGVLIADFQNLRFRETEALTIDRFNLSFHFRDNPAETRKWYDDVVAATEYIGPMS